MYYEELGGYYCFSGENADDILRKMEETPDDYMVITLQIELVKRLNWGLCNIVPELASEYEDICWLLFKRNENDNHLDKWFNANNEFMHTFHIVMKTNDKTPQEMKLMLQEMKIDMSFSTEFMGRNLWTGGNDASDGYPGVRFAVGLDMSRLLTSEEVWALNGNEDG